jgi:hypothetical protein
MIMISGDQSAKPAAFLADVVRDLDEAFKQAREAYAFAPSSFTASAFAAIATARDAFAAYHAVVIEEGGSEAEPSSVELQAEEGVA